MMTYRKLAQVMTEMRNYESKVMIEGMTKRNAVLVTRITQGEPDVAEANRSFDSPLSEIEEYIDEF